MGQRYIALDQGVGQQGYKLNAGETIPIDQTNPAVNLTTLFNGFRPLFQTLSADDVNKLAFEIIQVFQGESGTVADLVSSTSSLTNRIADKDAVIGRLVDNLTAVLDTVNARDDELDDMIVKTQQLVSGLADSRTTIGDSVTSLANLTDATAGLLEPVRASLQGSIAGLNELTGELASRQDEVNLALANLPIKMDKLGTAGYLRVVVPVLSVRPRHRRRTRRGRRTATEHPRLPADDQPAAVFERRAALQPGRWWVRANETQRRADRRHRPAADRAGDAVGVLHRLAADHRCRHEVHRRVQRGRRVAVR